MKHLQDLVVKFRDDRDWKQFHKPKDMAIALVLEANELLEIFQWKNEKEVKKLLKSKKFKLLKEEVSDVLFWVLLIAHDLKIDLDKEFKSKMKINERKYPISKAKGSNKKYTEY